MNDLITVPFHQHSVFALEQDGKRWVAVKPICEAIGVDWEGQRQRLKRDPVLSSTVVMMKAVAADEKEREMLFLDLDYLNGWLFGIDANRVKPELRERVIDYQRECCKVLAGHFMNQDRAALAKANNKLYQVEKTYFARYPRDREIRSRALMGYPFWHIAESVDCHPGTVSTALKRMVAWSVMEARALEVARLGMHSFWAHLRKHRHQRTFGF